MKKTLTVNLAGTVFHIDDDAYRLLDNYLNNLKLYFSNQSGAQEIVEDMEIRICELFLEKVTCGQQVITISDVEEVITRMGKPEDFDVIDDATTQTKSENESTTYGVKRHLFRNPDDKILGGVLSGFAAYFGLDTTLVRIAAILLLVFYGVMVPIYIVCWIIIPQAKTAADKLAMRGEAITVENIGKTVTDGFDKAANGVNEFINSGKPRSFLQKLGDIFVTIMGFFIKALMIVLVIIFFPVLLVLAIVFVVMTIIAIIAAITGGAMLMQLPFVEMFTMGFPNTTMGIVGAVSCIAAIGIPIAGVLWAILSALFKWPAMAAGLKWALIIVWAIAFVLALLNIDPMVWSMNPIGYYI